MSEITLLVFGRTLLLLVSKASDISHDGTFKFNPGLPNTLGQTSHPFSLQTMLNYVT